MHRVLRSDGGRRRVAAFVVLLAALVALTCLERWTETFQGVDSAVTTWAIAHRVGWLTPAAREVTHTGTSALLYPIVAAAGVVVWRRTGRWTPGLAALAVVVIGVLSRLALSKVVRDPRPPVGDRLVLVRGFAFPSGHANTSALVAGALALLLLTVVSSRTARIAIVAVVSGWAVAVAASRVYLGVHWVTDIAGSWLLAGTWLALLALSHDSSRRGAGLFRPQ